MRHKTDARVVDALAQEPVDRYRSGVTP